MPTEISLHIAGIVTLVAAFFYAIADILLLAHRIGPRQEIPASAIDFKAHKKWKPRADILTTMSTLPWQRIQIGGFLGVVLTPFVMSGSWVLYYALKPAGFWLSVPVSLLWLAAYPIGAFIHGSFMYFGSSVQAWNNAEGDNKLLFEDLVSKQLRVLIISYIIFFIFALATSAWYFIAVISGQTLLPFWMAFVNPFLMSIVYMLLVRFVIPMNIVKYVQGAGFNIVFLIFFFLLLYFIW